MVLDLETRKPGILNMSFSDGLLVGPVGAGAGVIDRCVGGSPCEM